MDGCSSPDDDNHAADHNYYSAASNYIYATDYDDAANYIYFSSDHYDHYSGDDNRYAAGDNNSADDDNRYATDDNNNADDDDNPAANYHCSADDDSDCGCHSANNNRLFEYASIVCRPTTILGVGDSFEFVAVILIVAAARLSQ
jgi:hypothetical protein